MIILLHGVFFFSLPCLERKAFFLLTSSVCYIQTFLLASVIDFKVEPVTWQQSLDIRKVNVENTTRWKFALCLCFLHSWARDSFLCIVDFLPFIHFMLSCATEQIYLLSVVGLVPKWQVNTCGILFMLDMEVSPVREEQPSFVMPASDLLYIFSSSI